VSSSTDTANKAYDLPRDLVKRVKKVLDAETETEAIILCMNEVAFVDDVERAVKATGGKLPGFRPLRQSSYSAFP
jgi:hypothetical protein